jgi:hypothetical protein
MKSFTDGPLRILLAIFAMFGMLRSLLALIEAVTNEPALTVTALLYLLLLICIFAGSYLLLQPRPSMPGGADDPAAGENLHRLTDFEKTYNTRLAGAILLTLATSLTLNTWLMPYLSLTPAQPTSTAAPMITASETAAPTPSSTPSVTRPAATLTSAPSPTPSRTATITPAPAGIRMQVILPRVHVRQEPTSRSASIGELNNGDWLYFDGRSLDEEGTLWLRIGPGQADPRFDGLAGNWVFSGGLDLVGLEDLPLLPATATPAG